MFNLATAIIDSDLFGSCICSGAVKVGRKSITSAAVPPFSECCLWVQLLTAEGDY